MPMQAPQWTDYLNCPVCCREFGPPPRSPISLGCGHTLCKQCLKQMHRKQCPFDQTMVHADPDELAVNTALLQLAGYMPPAQPHHPPCIEALPEADQESYDITVRCLEQLAEYVKLCATNSMTGNRLSRPMQRKLVTLLQCSITDEEGRGRAARSARSLGERTVTELILQHQNPQQLSANLWAAVRARGCQFLGPAMQEEVLKLVLLALEDGCALSRKVLVMFVVQRLEPHFPQASKTSIGHVVQLLYRASCFKVSKRESDSSLMQLKDEFRTYDALRREHDAQIVQIATEAGLRIAPDQWSALLYGDTTHKSNMQSIIDKLQTPQAFAQSVQELFIALQRTGDPAQLIVMSVHLDRLTAIDVTPEAKCPTWKEIADIIASIKEVVSGLVYYLQQQAAGRDANHNQKHTLQERPLDSSMLGQPSPQNTGSTPTHIKYKTVMCRDAVARSFCPRGNACTYAHFEEEMERYRSLSGVGQPGTNGNYAYIAPMASPMALQPLPQQLSQQLSQPLPQQLPQQLSQPLPQQLPQQLSQPLPQQLSQPLPQQLSQPLPQQLPQQLSQPLPPLLPQPLPPQLLQPMYARFPPPPLPQLPHAQHPHSHIDHSYSLPQIQLPPQTTHQEMIPSPDIPHSDGLQPGTYVSPVLHNQVPMGIGPSGLLIPIADRAYYGRFGGIVAIQEEPPNSVQYTRAGYASPVYQVPCTMAGPVANFQGQEQSVPSPLPAMFVPVQHEPVSNMSPYSYEELPSEILPDYRNNAPAFTNVQTRERIAEPSWPATTNVFTFEDMRNALPHCPAPSDDLYNVPGDRRVGGDRLTATDRITAAADLSDRADDKELEEELQALERRIDTEFKSTD